jgi:hypothetical protein
MDLDRIRAACEQTQSHVQHIAERRIKAERRLSQERLDAERRLARQLKHTLGRSGTKTADLRPRLFGAFGAVGVAALAVLLILAVRGQQRHAVSGPLVAAAVNTGLTRPSGELVSMETPSRSAQRSLFGQSGANNRLWTRKAAALRAEADMLAVAHSHRIEISSQAFSVATPVFGQLEQRRKAGDEVLLLIGRSEYARSPAAREAAARLAKAGVAIRLSSSNAKMAIDGDTVWIGSANATGSVPDQRDFGMVVTSSAIAAQLRKQFDDEWNKADAVYTPDSRRQNAPSPFGEPLPVGPS